MSEIETLKHKVLEWKLFGLIVTAGMTFWFLAFISVLIKE